MTRLLCSVALSLWLFLLIYRIGMQSVYYY